MKKNQHGSLRKIREKKKIVKICRRHTELELQISFGNYLNFIVVEIRYVDGS